MIKFYKQALLYAALCLGITLLAGYFTMSQAFLNVKLFPGYEGKYPWTSDLNYDALQGGKSQIVLHDDTYSLSFSMHLARAIQYPYASFLMAFTGEAEAPAQVNLSRFDSVRFRVKCQPANVLSLSLYTEEPGLTQAGKRETYRTPTAFFSCGPQWQEVEIDVRHMETPQWWLEEYNLDLSSQAYDLAEVSMMAFNASFQSPVDVDAFVNIDAMALRGLDARFLYLFAAFSAILWGVYLYAFIRGHLHYTAETIRDKLQRDRPLVAYKQLTVEPQKHKETAAVLRFMASEYADPDLSLEAAVKALGVNRNKINDILKHEIGYTFSAYLNKLRLTEAARLLAEKPDAKIAEIVYSVGYKSVAYFNTLFKKEYGCTPKVFKNACANGDRSQTE